MTPEQLDDCLSIIRWSPDTLAQALECDVSLIMAWQEGRQEMPAAAAAWIEMLAILHEKAQVIRPIGLKSKRVGSN
jgi:hypothetical protein